MTETVLNWVYICGLPIGFVAGCRTGYALIVEKDDDPKEWATAGYIVGVCCGVLGAMLWPLALAAVLGRNVLFESKARRKSRELDEREAKIAAMERELNLDKPSPTYRRFG